MKKFLILYIIKHFTKTLCRFDDSWKKKNKTDKNYIGSQKIFDDEGDF